MMFRTSILCCVLFVGNVTTSSAQVIQLPTFRFFTVSTTVSVPVNGGAYLGGVKRAQYGMTSRGTPGLGKLPVAGRLFRNRGIGSSVVSSGASVSATVIDHAEMDARLLAEAAGRRPAGTTLTETDRKALILSSHVSRPEGPGLRLDHRAPRESVAAIRKRNDVAARAHLAEMQDYWQRGQQAESLKRWGAARVCYDVIVRRGSGELRTKAATRLAELRAQAKAAAAKKQAASDAKRLAAETSISPSVRSKPAVPAPTNRLP